MSFGSINRISFFVTVSLFAQTAMSDEPASRPLSKEQCEQLVEKMVNPNPCPFEKNFVRDLPKGVTQSEIRKSLKPIGYAYFDLSKNI